MKSISLVTILAVGSVATDVTLIRVPSQAPSNAQTPYDEFVSFSIEPSSALDFAGNLSAPNAFSYNLLKNIKNLAGEFPIMRFGGNTQDQIRFDPDSKVAFKGVLNPAISSDYPTNIVVGPSYYEFYQTWPGVRFIHGFNLGNITNWPTTIKSAPYVCRALKDNAYLYSIGNEPDLFWLAGQRSNITYNETQYFQEWTNMYNSVHASMSCKTKFFAPSFAGVKVQQIWKLDPIVAWSKFKGLIRDRSVKEFSQHNYMTAATNPGVTLQRTLMNHSSIVESADKLMTVFSRVDDAPWILGEHNSLARQGKPGLSNSFGAALWGVDFNLLMASRGVRRSHMHQGTNYRYQSWQPVEGLNTKGTKAPYYGNIGVAAFLGGVESLVNIPIDEMNAAYAGYNRHKKLKRVILINFNQYNASAWNQEYINSYARPTKYFKLDTPCGGSIRRLMANGSDAITGITFDGYSYNWELDNGKAVLLRNVTRNECVRAGRESIAVPYSSAAIVDLYC